MHPTPSNGWFAESSIGPDLNAPRTRRRFPRRCRARAMVRGLRRKRTGKTHVFGCLPLCPRDRSACGAHAAPAQVSLAVSLRREFVLGRTRAGSSLKGVSRLAAPPCLWANLVRSKSSQGDRMNGIVEKRPTIGGAVARHAPEAYPLKEQGGSKLDLVDVVVNVKCSTRALTTCPSNTGWPPATIPSVNRWCPVKNVVRHATIFTFSPPIPLPNVH